MKYLTQNNKDKYVYTLFIYKKCGKLFREDHYLKTIKLANFRSVITILNVSTTFLTILKKDNSANTTNY